MTREDIVERADAYVLLNKEDQEFMGRFHSLAEAREKRDRFHPRSVGRPVVYAVFEVED